MVAAAVYLLGLFLFIPFHFQSYLLYADNRDAFPHEQFAAFLAALLSICCAVLLGFADDVLDLRWR